MGNKVYVTGSSGFIGQHVRQHIVDQGDTAVFDFSRSLNTIPDCDAIVHLSAYGNHYDQADVGKTIQANILDLQKIISHCKLHSEIRKIFNISTSSVTLPHQTLYSATKFIGEALINELKDPRFVNVHPYSVYGPGEAAHRFIPTVIRHLHSGEKMYLDPHATHDWIYVQDFIELMFTGYTSVGTGIKTTNLQVVEILEHISGKKLNYEVRSLRSFDTDNWVCPDKLPVKVLLYEGLKRCYDTCQTNN